ncbi:MAG: hypothetical protein K2O11_02855, partial [Oscillospiraceae bacterium]|nr:hypothetical protein [Oscillospiraceae bacterium]
GLMRLLRQPQYNPLSQHQQVIVLTAAMDHVMQDVPLAKMDGFRAGLLAAFEEEAPDLCTRIDQTGKLSQEDREEILLLARDYLKRFQSGGARED